MVRHFLALFSLLCCLWHLPCNGSILCGELTKVIRLSPGEERPVKLTLKNTSAEEERVNLRQVDYSYNCQGENFFEEIGTSQRSNGSWIELQKQQVIVPPMGSVDVYYVVRVPLKEGLSGSYSSAILVEPEKFISKVDPDQENSLALNVKVRYCYVVITHIGQGKPELKILSKQLVSSEGQQLLQVDVANTGELHLRPKLIAKLFNGQSKLLVNGEAAARNISPGNSVRYLLPLTDVKSEPLIGFLLLDDGDEHLFGEKVQITPSA